MTDISRLLFQRENFPIVLHETTGSHGIKFWDFSRIEIPPYHPAMGKEGIDFRSVPSLLDEAVEWTVKDLEEIADKRGDVQATLRDVTKDPKTGKVLYAPQTVFQQDLGIAVDSVPVVGHFYVGRDGINPYGYHGDQGIRISPKLAAPSFMVPDKVTFSEELMLEYGMKEEGVFFGRKRISCPNGWYRHNLATLNAIFYKNLAIVMDNAVVRAKYST